MACRLLLNLYDDDLLRRLVPGQAIPVPYARAGVLKGFALLAQPTAKLADIREFFPDQKPTSELVVSILTSDRQNLGCQQQQRRVRSMTKR